MAKLARSITCYNSAALSSGIRAQILAMAPKYLDGCIDADGTYFIDNMPASFPLRYFNLTDLPNNGSQLAWGLTRAAARGVPVPENILLHFRSDTVVNLLGTDYLIPGFGSGSAAQLSDARVPIYYQKNAQGIFPRVMTNFSTAAIRGTWQDYVIEQVLSIPYSAGHFPKGVWLDNATDTTFNVDCVSLNHDAAGRDVWGSSVLAGGGSWAATGPYDYRIVPTTSLGDGISSLDVAVTIASVTQHVQLDWNGAGIGTYKIYRKPHASSWTVGDWRVATVTGGVKTYIDNGGTVIAGSGGPSQAGTIYEDAGSSKFLSPQFDDWKWNTGHGLWIRELTDLIATAPAWLAGRQAKVVANVANHPDIGAGWNARYSNFNATGSKVCDGVFREFCGSTIRDADVCGGLDAPLNTYNAFQTAATAGLDCWETGFHDLDAYPTATPVTRNGRSLSGFEVMRDVIARAWLVRPGSGTGLSMILGAAETWVPSNDPTVPPLPAGFSPWQYNTPAIWDLDLGTPVGAPTLLASGVVAGNNYKVYGREYTNGYVTSRSPGGSSQTCAATMDVTVTLPAGTWLPVTALDGTLGSAQTSYTHVNGQSYLWVKSGAPPADTTAPTAISTLAAPASTPNSVDLTFTATGDDGGTGTAMSYDMRYLAGATITQGNFLTGTQVPGLTAPKASGQAEAFTVSNLLPGTTYTFAVVAVDEAGNRSLISNVVSKATAAAVDVTPPAAISTLAATNVAATPASGGAPQVLLSWTAPTDASGCVEYDIRVATVLITAGNFGTVGQGLIGDVANHVLNTPVPLAGGSPSTFLLAGRYRTDSGSIQVPTMPDLTQLFFAMKTKDGAGNWSAISNGVSLTTGPLVDFGAPNPVNDLVVVSSTDNSVTLRFTAPSDDTGANVSSYEGRYSQTTLTAGTFPTAALIAGLPTPKPAGQVETVTVFGLPPATIQSFALISRDAAGNASVMSNAVSGATKSSPVAPTPAATVTVRGPIQTIPIAPYPGAPPLLTTFPQYANLYWNGHWGADNDTTPGRDQILRVLANNKVVIFDEHTTNPYTTLGHDFGIPDAAARLRAMNSDILVGIAGNAWTTNAAASLYWPFRTALLAIATSSDWFVRFDNNVIVYSDGDAQQYPMIDLTNPACRNWFADNVRRYYMNLGYDLFNFWFADEMQSGLAAIPTQASGKTPANIALYNGSQASRTVLAAGARDAAWLAANTAMMARMPDVLVMPNGTTDPSPTTIGRMVQGMFPGTKPDNELPNIYAHFRNTRRANRLMFYHAEWGSAMPQWLNSVNLTDSQLSDMDVVSLSGGSPVYLAQASWPTYRLACLNLACAASVFDGVGQLEIATPGNFSHPWQYFGVAPGAFGTPVEYVDGLGVEFPRINIERLNQGNTLGSAIYWRDFTKAKVAFNWQNGAVGGTPTALVWSVSGASVAANSGAIVWK